MTPLELAGSVLAFGTLLSCLVARRVLPWLLAASALTLAAALIANSARWQIYPMAVALMLLAFLLRHRRPFARTMALGGALLLLGVSATLAQLMAMPQLPAPSGPYPVGTVERALERPTAHGPRRLFLKVWYPARKTAEREEGLWSDLQEMTGLPWYIRWSLAYLSHAPTHSHAGAPYAPGAAVHVVLYNHSFVSWASENSLLAEELASRGFTVIAVSHRGQFDEYRELDARYGNKALGAMVVEMVRGRSGDSRLVADGLDTLIPSIPGMKSDAPKTYEAVGFSLGGAVATSLCATDRRCLAVANIDGAVPGVDYARLPIPHYLMICSGATFRGLGAAARDEQGGYRERVFPQAVHADFHDSAVAIPATRWFFGRTVAALEGEKRETAGTIADFLTSAVNGKP